MPFIAIKGEFQVLNYKPDGDSIRFKADNPDNWRKLGGSWVRLNSRKHAQLRFEAIDTLETHYFGTHQPKKFANRATDRLLELLRIPGVEWDDTGTKVVNPEEGTPGWVLSRSVEPNHRPVSFVYPAGAKFEDGQEVFLDEKLITTSVNYTLLAEGLAYPTYYTGLFPDLREALTDVYLSARNGKVGLWPHDVTNSGFEVRTFSDVEDHHVILPKLFRRISGYMRHGGDILGLIDNLETREDPVLIISTGHATNLDTIVTLDDHTVRLESPPEDLMFLS